MNPYAAALPLPIRRAGRPAALRILIAFATFLVDAGLAITTNLVSGIGGTVPRYVGWGTGAGTTAVGNTTLFTEDSGGSPAYARVAATITRITTTKTNDTIQYVATLVANASKTITNAGIFDNSAGGNLFAKGDFTGKALDANDSMVFTFSVQYKDE